MALVAQADQRRSRHPRRDACGRAFAEHRVDQLLCHERPSTTAYVSSGFTATPVFDNSVHGVVVHTASHSASPTTRGLRVDRRSRT